MNCCHKRRKIRGQLLLQGDAQTTGIQIIEMLIVEVVRIR
jgi:hypothetical protein